MRERRKNFFPVSVEINEDSELWKLTDRFGVGGLRLWLEVLSILEKTFNQWDATEEAWEAVFRKVRIRPRNGWLIRRYLVATGWLRGTYLVGNPQVIRTGSPNYWKYHKSECSESTFVTCEVPSLLTELNSDSSYKNTQSPKSAPSADPSDLLKLIQKWEVKMASMNLIPELKEIADKVYFSDPVKFKRLAAWIAQGRKRNWRETDMAETLRRFVKKDRKEVEDWYSYLDTILANVEADRGRDSSLAEHERHKAEVREAAEMFRVK